MTGALRELYQELILDHHRRPRNFGPMAGADCTAAGFNPLCGDRVSVHVRMDGDRVADVRFEGAGCAISTASASLMTETLKGKTRAEADAIAGVFHRMLTAEAPAEPADLPPKLGVFAGVREFPVRVKCATLPWHTLRSALAGVGEVVTTE